MKLRLDLTIPIGRTTLSAQLESNGVLWGLSGPSGGGKSSLLRALAGVESRALGIIDVDGTTWLDSFRKRSIPADARRVGWTPQEALLFPHLSVRQNLTFSRRVEASPDALSEVAHLLELDKLLARQPAHLSGGERQRVALGRALLSSPRLLLLDEPFSALDRPLRRRVIDRLSDFLERRSLPAIIVSHDQSDLAHLSFISWEIDSGRLLQHEATSLGSASEARHNPAHGSSSGVGRPR